MDFSIAGLVQAHTTQVNYAFEKIVKAILYHSKLEVSLVRISSVTDDTFHVSLEARATNTGPVSATVSKMTLDLCGPSGCFGRIILPEMATQPNGTRVVVTNQMVWIHDKAALQVFIASIMLDSEATLSLENGQCKVKALGIGPKPIIYQKAIRMKGMKGPMVAVEKATATQTGIDATLKITNASPMEISFGICTFEIQNDDGDVFAELKGRLDIKIGVFEAKVQGPVDRSVIMKGPARLVGKRCVGAVWCDEAIKAFDVQLGGMRTLMAAVGLESTDPEPPREVKSVSLKWWQR